MFFVFLIKICIIYVRVEEKSSYWCVDKRFERLMSERIVHFFRYRAWKKEFKASIWSKKCFVLFFFSLSSAQVSNLRLMRQTVIGCDLLCLRATYCLRPPGDVLPRKIFKAKRCWRGKHLKSFHFTLHVILPEQLRGHLSGPPSRTHANVNKRADTSDCANAGTRFYRWCVTVQLSGEKKNLHWFFFAGLIVKSVR